MNMHYVVLHYIQIGLQPCSENLVVAERSQVRILVTAESCEISLSWHVSFFSLLQFIAVRCRKFIAVRCRKFIAVRCRKFIAVRCRKLYLVQSYFVRFVISQFGRKNTLPSHYIGCRIGRRELSFCHSVKFSRASFKKHFPFYLPNAAFLPPKYALNYLLIL